MLLGSIGSNVCKGLGPRIWGWDNSVASSLAGVPSEQMTKLPRRNRAEQLGENLKGLHGVQKKGFFR